MSDIAIRTDNLRKEFGKKVAVAGLTLQVNRGEVFGFLGPNGAGKTTSIKMLLGLISSTSGAAELLGKPIRNQEMRRRIGYLPEHFRFYHWITGGEFLDVQGKLYGMSKAERRAKIPEMLKLVGLPDQAENTLGSFSKGMTQRIGLAQALMNAPDLVFLDEPTSGLDPIGRKLVREIIDQLRGKGTAVFVNSHLLSEIEQTCDRVAFIQQGRVIETHRLADLDEGAVGVRLRVSGADGTVSAATLDHFRAISSDCHQTHTGHFQLTLPDESHIPQLVHWLSEQKLNVYELTPQRLSLEDRFLRVMSDNEETE